MVILKLIVRYYKGCFQRIFVFSPSIRHDVQHKPLVDLLDSEDDGPRQ